VLVGRWKDRSVQIIDRSKDDKVFAHAIKNKKDKIEACVIVFSTPERRKVYIHYLVTHPCAQGKGLGKALIFSIFEQYPEIKTIYLHTGLHNKKAQGFYEHVGFTEMYRDLTSMHYKLYGKNYDP